MTPTFIGRGEWVNEIIGGTTQYDVNTIDRIV